jgi:hypothetical protein
MFVTANGGTRAYIIARDSGSNKVRIQMNGNNNVLWTSDTGAKFNITSNGFHYVSKCGKKIIYLIDMVSGSTCIVADSLNTVLSSKNYTGFHARALTATKKNAVLTFVNDVGSGIGNAIVHVNVDSVGNFVNSKKMMLDTFRYENFNCVSAIDSSFTYCLFNKKLSNSSTIFVQKFNFAVTTCNEQLYTPTITTVNYTSTVASITCSGSAVQTTYTPFTFNKGLKDSVYCFKNVNLNLVGVQNVVSKDIKIWLYPMPANYYLEIEIDASAATKTEDLLKGSNTIVIYNTIGQLLNQQQFQIQSQQPTSGVVQNVGNIKFTIQTNYFPNGFYLLKLFSVKSVETTSPAAKNVRTSEMDEILTKRFVISR